MFAKHYINAVIKSDILASFVGPNASRVKGIQDYFHVNYNIPQVFSRSLEPFYQIQEHIVPWTHHLKDKKVLIINPFVDSFKQQIQNGFQIFKSQKVFLDNQQFVFYKSYQTIAMNHIHDNWFETYKIMCEDIRKLDFDIALLGCGAYGLPLCNFIKSELNKSAIYIGGGLQLLFGVMGIRWENIDMWKKIKENDSKFIRPSKNETIERKHLVDNGCYW